MEPQAGATAVNLILAWGAPLVLLVVVSVRFFQRRRKRSRVVRARERTVTEPTGKSNRPEGGES